VKDEDCQEAAERSGAQDDQCNPYRPDAAVVGEAHHLPAARAVRIAPHHSGQRAAVACSGGSAEVAAHHEPHRAEPADGRTAGTTAVAMAERDMHSELAGTTHHQRHVAVHRRVRLLEEAVLQLRGQWPAAATGLCVNVNSLFGFTLSRGRAREEGIEESVD
jgi:hypothetical protein